MHSPYWRHLREIAEGICHSSAIGRRRVSAAFCFQPLYTIALVYILSRYSRSNYLSWMSLQIQLLDYLFFNTCARSGCFSRLFFIFQSHLGLELAGCQVVRKSYLRPHAPRGCVKLQRQKLDCGARSRLPNRPFPLTSKYVQNP